MPALPNVNNVMRIDLGFHLAEDLAAKVHEFWAFGGTPSVSDLNTLAATIMDDWSTASVPALMSADKSLETVTITNLTSPTAGVGTHALHIPGTDMSDALPASVCVLESREIARRYRGGHPRAYWPFGHDTVTQDAQTWMASFVTLVTSTLLAWRNDWTTDLPASISSVTPVNVSYYAGFTVHTGTTGRARNVSTVRGAAVVDNVTSRIVRAGMASQRKRLLRLA